MKLTPNPVPLRMNGKSFEVICPPDDETMAFCKALCDRASLDPSAEWSNKTLAYKVAARVVRGLSDYEIMRLSFPEIAVILAAALGQLVSVLPSPDPDLN